MLSQQPYYDSSSSVKVQHFFEITKCYSQFLTISFTIVFIFFIGILKYLWKQHHVLQWG